MATAWPRYSMETVAKHRYSDDCWIVVNDRVYDMTSHVKHHEGWTNGSKNTTLLAVLSGMGQDCTLDFEEVHSEHARRQLAALQIGVLDKPNAPRSYITFRTWDELIASGVLSSGSGSGSSNAEDPITLEMLPVPLVQQILCAAGCARTADALACCSKALALAASAATAENVLPIAPVPDRSLPARAAVAWDSKLGVLRTTGRLGPSDILFERFRVSRDVVMQFDVTRLPSVGGVRVGLLGYHAASKNHFRERTSPMLDGAGRVTDHLASQEAPAQRLYGERIREGDRVGVALLASVRNRLQQGRRHYAMAFLLNGALMGPPMRVSAECSHFRFCMQFDLVEGAAATLVRSCTTPFDRTALLATAATYTPRPPPSPPHVLVRTTGPDSRSYSVPMDVQNGATVADLVRAVAPVLGVGEWEAIELRVDGKLIYAGDSDANSESAPGVFDTPLSAVGVVIDPASGCHAHDVMVSQPHLIS